MTARHRRCSPKDLGLGRPLRPLERATTLPPNLYTDPEVYALETERVFRRSWLPVGRTDQIARPGDYRSIDLCGEPIVLVRDRDGEARALSRVCRHRSMRLVEGEGNRKSFQCPYHLWTYGLDGRLLGAPEMHRAEGFDPATCRLPEFRTEVWEGWIFLCFDPEAAPLAPVLEPLRSRIAPWRLGEMRTAATLVYDSPWNWKVMVENFIESYHHLGVHPETFQPTFPAADSFVEDVEGPFTILHNPRRPRKARETDSPSTLIDEVGGSDDDELLVCSVFPFHLFALLSDHVVWFQIEPDTVEHFLLRIHLLMPPELTEGPDATARIERLRETLAFIHAEDIRACEGVQAGLRSRHAEAGRLSHLEKAVWQFHRFLLTRLAEER